MPSLLIRRVLPVGHRHCHGCSEPDRLGRALSHTEKAVVARFGMRYYRLLALDFAKTPGAKENVLGAEISTDTATDTFLKIYDWWHDTTPSYVR